MPGAGKQGFLPADRLSAYLLTDTLDNVPRVPANFDTCGFIKVVAEKDAFVRVCADLD